MSGEARLEFHFQPIVDLQRGVVTGYEGLVRFPRDLRWTPDQWFAAAERLGQRLELEELVTRQVIQRRRALPLNCFLSINASPSFVLSSRWDDLLERERSLTGVVVEITENEAVQNYGPLLEKLARIRKAGGWVAVDDAGSGYASLHHVMAIHPNFVKLDRVFVSGCDSDRAKSALIEMVGMVAGRLDAWIIAEGVETAGELDELIRLRAPMAQGYYLARPTAAMEPLASAKEQEILGRVKVLTPQATVESATEAVPVCGSDDEARALLSEEANIWMAVVTDGYQRPVGLVERHPLLGVRTVPEPLLAQCGTADVEALQRALTRPPARRLDSIIAIDEQGNFVGVAPVDRLAKQVLDRR